MQRLTFSLTTFLLSLALIPFAWAQSYDVDVDFDMDEFKSDYLADTEFMTGEGKRVNLRQYRGKPVVLNFWGTWCPPCVAEMPILDQLADELKGKAHVIAIAETQDGKADPYTLIKDVKDFMKKKKLENLDIYVDIFSQLFVMFETGNSIPTTIILDKDGKEIFRQQGALGWNADAFKKRVMDVVSPLVESTPSPSAN